MRSPNGSSERACIICGKTFRCCPSDNYTTCSKECQSIRARNTINKRIANGEIDTPWTDERRTRANQNENVIRQRKDSQKAATEAAKLSPVAGRFETNQNAKVWTLISPDGVEYRAQNLLLWARDNTHLFKKPTGDRSAAQIAHGFAAIAQTIRGKRKPGRGAMSYFGWTLKCLPEEQEKQK
jgi:hypothetical protein